MQDEFAKRNVKMVGYSCNDHQTHWHWIKDIFIATGGYVRFPIFADPTRQTAIQLGILDKSAKDDEGLPLTLRAVYVLKPDKTIALTMTYPMSTGRNFDEILRIVDALQLTEKHSVATPANWTPGKDVIVNLGLDDEQADEKFGSDGWRAIQLPSEMEKRKKLIAEAEEMAKNDASGKEGRIRRSRSHCSNSTICDTLPTQDGRLDKEEMERLVPWKRKRMMMLHHRIAHVAGVGGG